MLSALFPPSRWLPLGEVNLKWKGTELLLEVGENQRCFFERRSLLERVGGVLKPVLPFSGFFAGLALGPEWWLLALCNFYQVEPAGVKTASALVVWLVPLAALCYGLLRAGRYVERQGRPGPLHVTEIVEGDSRLPFFRIHKRVDEHVNDEHVNG